MVANVDITRFCRAIVLVTNRAVVRDLEVSAPPNFMSLRRASFWTCPKKHTDTMSLSFLGRLGLGGDGVWGWGLGMGMGMGLGMGLGMGGMGLGVGSGDGIGAGGGVGDGGGGTLI